MDEIKILSTLEGIRTRPEMYLSVALDSPSIIPTLITQTLCWSLDEAASGAANEIHVRLHSDRSFSVMDNGEGMSIAPDAIRSKPMAEIIMTELMACKDAKQRKDIGEKYCHSGIVVTNALSLWCILEIHSKGQLWRQHYNRGKPMTPIQLISQTQTTGTLIRFRPDPQIVLTQEINLEELCQKLSQAAYDVPETRVQLTDERTDKSLSLLDIRSSCPSAG